MLYLNFNPQLDGTSGNNNVILASNSGSFPITIRSLLLIADLRSSPRNFFQRSLQLKFRKKDSQKWVTVAEISLVNKGSIYRENLLEYLTNTPEFVIAPNHEMSIAITGNPLSGSDVVNVLGLGFASEASDVNGSGSASSVVQNFVTATYNVPTRDALVALPLTSNWAALDTPRSPKYYKDQIGRIHFSGFVKQLTQTQNDTVCILPAGFRPLEDLDFLCQYQSGSYTLRVLMNGNVQNTFAPGAFINLNGISFLGA